MPDLNQFIEQILLEDFSLITNDLDEYCRVYNNFQSYLNTVRNEIDNLKKPSSAMNKKRSNSSASSSFKENIPPNVGELKIKREKRSMTKKSVQFSTPKKKFSTLKKYSDVILEETEIDIIDITKLNDSVQTIEANKNDDSPTPAATAAAAGNTFVKKKFMPPLCSNDKQNVLKKNPTLFNENNPNKTPKLMRKETREVKNNSLMVLNQNTVKKTVEVFEKMGATNSAKATRTITRTKSKPTISTPSGNAKIQRNKKEDPAKKREKLLQTLIEERKRKQEAKLLKAQQEKQMKKLKEVKKPQKAATCTPKSKEMAAINPKKNQPKILSKRQLDMMIFIENEKAKRRSNCPKYLTLNTPLLPTFDCYDSDDERSSEKIIEPYWATDKALKEMELCMNKAGHKLRNSFFSLQTQTIDLKTIFQTDDPKILERNSSARWNFSPEYSLLPILENDEDEA